MRMISCPLGDILGQPSGRAHGPSGGSQWRSVGLGGGSTGGRRCFAPPAALSVRVLAPQKTGQLLRGAARRADAPRSEMARRPGHFSHKSPTHESPNGETRASLVGHHYQSSMAELLGLLASIGIARWSAGWRNSMIGASPRVQVIGGRNARTSACKT